MAESSSKQRVDERQLERCANQWSVIVYLLVGMCFLVLWLEPKSRPVLGALIRDAGKLLENVGQNMHAPPEAPKYGFVAQAAAQSPPNDSGWLFGFGIAAAPFLMLTWAYQSGWLSGCKETGEQWRETTRFVR